MNKVLFSVNQICFLHNGPYSIYLTENEVAGLTGPSGIGKTQMLRAIVEAIQHSGTVSLQSISAKKHTPTKWRKRVALVPAEPVWWRDTVGEHFNEAATDADVLRILDKLGFTKDTPSWRISRMSTGERQRLALARALVLKPEILLLDEPCSALDPQSIVRVEKLLANYVEEAQRAIIWVSHDLDQLKRVANSCYIVEQKTLTKLWPV